MTFDSENVADPLRSGFCALESLNETTLRPGRGLTLRDHRADVESITYVLAGTLIRQDSSGTLGRLEAGEFQRTRADRGTARRAVNGSLVDCVKIVQIAIKPDREHLRRSDEQKRFLVAERKGIFRLIASPNGHEASLRIRQDVQIYSSLIDPGTHLIHELRAGRSAWLHVVKGRILLLDYGLRGGDGAALVGEAAVSLTGQEASEILLLDLA